MKQLMSVSLIGLSLLATGSLMANEATEAKIKAAMESDLRTEQEVDRDRNRRPVDTLAFFGLEDDMTIVELLPGGGWYAKLLVPVVADKGQYYGAIGTSRVESMTSQPGMEKMQIIAKDATLNRPEGSHFYDLELSSLGVTDVDMVLTFRNYHNFSASGRAAMNKAAYDALKPGGIYAVVDHTRRHMEGDSDENRRRFDPVLAIKEIQDAGFELVDFSDMHYKADDELEYEVGRRSVSGNTDRWTLKFRKKD